MKQSVRRIICGTNIFGLWDLMVCGTQKYTTDRKNKRREELREKEGLVLDQVV